MEKINKTKKVRVLNNNFYLFRMLFKIAPMRVVTTLINSLFDFGSWAFFSAIFMRYIVDAFEQNKDADSVFLFIGIVMAAYFVIDGFSSWFNKRYRPVTDRVIHYKLNKILFSKAADVDISCFEDSEFYNSYTVALNQASTRAIAILDNMSDIVAALLSAMFLSYTMFMLDYWTVLFLLIPFVSYIFGTITTKLRHQKYLADVLPNRKKDYMGRAILLKRYAKEIRLTNAYNFLDKIYDDGYKGIEKNVKKYGKKIFLFRNINGNLNFTLSFNSIWLYAAYMLIVKNTFSTGDFVVMAGAIVSVSNMLRNMIENVVVAFQNAVYISDVRTFLNHKGKISEAQGGEVPNSDSYRLEFKNVSFKYFGEEKYTLKNINMTIKPNEIVALVGHNGAGKSTIVKLMMRLYDPTEGEILLNSVDIKQFSVREYRNLFSTVFQDFQIFAMPLIDNVNMNEEIDEQRIKECKNALKKSGIYEKAISLDNGIDTPLTKEFDDKGVVLSGGEAQRLAIARVYAQNSPIIILDEPSSALDPIAEYEMYESLSDTYRNKNDKMVVLISHRLSFAILADKIYFLENGSVLEEGTHSELMSLNHAYADMFNKQAQSYQK